MSIEFCPITGPVSGSAVYTHRWDITYDEFSASTLDATTSDPVQLTTLPIGAIVHSVGYRVITIFAQSDSPGVIRLLAGTDVTGEEQIYLPPNQQFTGLLAERSHASLSLAAGTWGPRQVHTSGDSQVLNVLLECSDAKDLDNLTAGKVAFLAQISTPEQLI